MPSPRINIAHSASDMDRVAPLWNALLKKQSHTIFQRFSWNRLAAEIFRDRLTPHVVWVESDAGAAIIPAALHHTTNQIELIGDALFDYRDVLHAGDDEILRLAWQEVARCGKHLCVVALEEAAARERWPDFSVLPFANAPQVDRTIVDEGSFRLAHSRLGRQMRRLNRLGASLRTYSGENSEAIRRLYDCKRSHFAEDNLFLDQRRCDFLVALVAAEAKSCELFTLETDTALVAGLLTFRDGGIRRFYTIYFDPQWARHSPGVALVYEVTARALAAGLSCDYMTGEYPYKLRLANASRALYKVEMSAQELANLAAGEVTRVA
jgi:CelD/BcsL family acetyltransferase involved in cellulose biosynthesis